LRAFSLLVFFFLGFFHPKIECSELNVLIELSCKNVSALFMLIKSYNFHSSLQLRALMRNILLTLGFHLQDPAIKKQLVGLNF
jgi:hypothetical protein